MPTARYGILHTTPNKVRVARSRASQETFRGERHYYAARMEVRIPDGTIEGRPVFVVEGRLTKAALAHAIALAAALDAQFGADIRKTPRAEVTEFRNYVNAALQEVQP